MTRTIKAADLFCGGGGTSTGLFRACDDLGIRADLLAVNHWQTAIKTHSANHPTARHICEPVDNVNPRDAVPGGHLDLLWASPECTHHSVARGGRPVNDQSRASAWCVLRWATALRIDNILIENVKEFATWGPLGVRGRPIKARKGETFRAFVRSLESLGYRVESRVLNAADYGAATTRERLFIQARLGRRCPSWPEPTHAPKGGATLFRRLKKWRPAREIIDWSIPGKSIFSRERPLSPNTLARIAAGLKKFGGPAAEPFLVMLYGANTVRSVDRPLPTVTAGGNHIGLAQPFIVPFRGENSVQQPRCHSVDEPMPTVTTVNGFGVVEPFIVGMEHKGRTFPVNRPMPTITTADAFGVVQPFLVKYNSNGGPRSVDQPIDTLTTKDRYGLIQPVQYDILFRMLRPHELAAAMSFPAKYQFCGNREQQVKQIGNAVDVKMATALCRSVLEDAA